MIHCEGITRKFGQLTAVHPLHFEIPKGQVVGFIGPNGAGKTTTMRMLTGYLPATEGKATIGGFDTFSQNREVKRQVGYLPETPPLYPELTIGQYLQFVSTLREIPRSEIDARIGEVMEQVGLRGWEKRRIASLSKGYRQRVGLAQAILHRPSVLILDEPTSGLDPKQVAGIRSFLKNLAADRTVIFSTHILSEVEKLCDRILFLHHGKIIADVNTLDLGSLVGGGFTHLEIKNPSKGISKSLADCSFINRVEVNNSTSEIWSGKLSLIDSSTSELTEWLYKNGSHIVCLETINPTLEDVFLELIKEEV